MCEALGLGMPGEDPALVSVRHMLVENVKPVCKW